jgi:hypothetical protein
VHDDAIETDIAKIATEIAGMSEITRIEGPRPLQWYRYDNYRIEEGNLLGRDGVVLYLAETISDLEDHFTGVSGNKSILEFAHKFGFLGFAEMMKRPIANNPTEPLSLEFRERPVLRRIPREVDGGESVEWILAHANTFRAVRSTALLLETFRHEANASIFRKMKSIWQAGPFAIRQCTHEPLSVFDTGASRLEGAQLWEAVQSEKMARTLMEIYINENLRGIHPLVGFEPNGRESSGFEFSTLLDLIYWRASQDIKHSRLRMCRECLEVFRVQDPRQLYCKRECTMKSSLRRYRAKRATSRRKR